MVGGARSTGGRFPRRLTIVLMNRGGRPFKSSLFAELIEIGASEIISVEGPAAQYDVENLARRHPEVRFLLLTEPVGAGEKINIGMEEAKGEFVLVMWNDMRVVSGFSEATFARVVRTPALCTVPVLQSVRKETIPSIRVPALYRRQLKIVPGQPSADGEPTIYPFDYCGLYRKEAFTLSGGFDYLLENSYWQKLDFGFRAFMWGERIVCSTSLRLQYRGEPPTEDSSRDESYKLFFLKNLAVRFNRDAGVLPVGRLIRYFLGSGGDLITAYREFREVSRWVELNRYRFKRDARSVTELWEMIEP